MARPGSADPMGPLGPQRPHSGSTPDQPSAPVGSRRRDWGGVGLALALQLGCAVLALLGAGRPVQLAFPVLAVVLAGALLVARKGALYVEFVVWLWLLSPGLRRVVDLDVGWTPISPVMAAAPVATLLCLVPALLGRRRVHALMGGALVLSLAVVAYGAVVGALTVGPGSAAAALLIWLPPLALGLYVATAGPTDRDQLTAVVRRVAIAGCLLLGGYGIVQFLVLPLWDAFWMDNAPINSIGRSEPFEVRVFSTLNAPAPFAAVLGTLLILLSGCHVKGRVAATVVGVVALGLTLVRTAWLGYAVALLSMLAPGRGRLLRSAAAGVGVPVVALVLLGGPILTAITTRFASTRAEGANDASLTERVTFYSEQLPAVLTNPIGQGLGSVGVATKVGNAGQLGGSGNFDGGVLELLYVFGLPLGLALLAAVVMAVGGAWRAARPLTDLDKAMAAALVGLVVQLPLSNPLTTPTGVLFWLLVGLLARPSVTPVDAPAGSLSARPASAAVRR